VQLNATVNPSETPRTPVWGRQGSCARVAFTWTVAGGIACGGILVGTLTLTGAVPSGFQLLAAPVLFLVGVFLGLVHGIILGTVGRPPGITRGGAIGRGLVGGLAALPAVLAGWVVTAGISLTAALVEEFTVRIFVMAAIAWIIGLAFCTWAGLEGLSALRRAVERWPESRAGSILTAAILVVSTVVLLRYPPDIILDSGLRLNGVGAFALACAVTLWLGLPLVIVVLRYTHTLFLPHSSGGEVGT
jgi:hypothetical protein